MSSLATDSSDKRFRLIIWASIGSEALKPSPCPHPQARAPSPGLQPPSCGDSSARAASRRLCPHHRAPADPSPPHTTLLATLCHGTKSAVSKIPDTVSLPPERVLCLLLLAASSHIRGATRSWLLCPARPPLRTAAAGHACRCWWPVALRHSFLYAALSP